MIETRYQYLMETENDPPGLTEAELAEGWHFCVEWDGLLVGPDMTEALACQCGVPGIMAAKPALEIQQQKERDACGPLPF